MQLLGHCAYDAWAVIEVVPPGTKTAKSAAYYPGSGSAELWNYLNVRFTNYLCALTTFNIFKHHPNEPETLTGDSATSFAARKTPIVLRGVCILCVCVCAG